VSHGKTGGTGLGLYHARTTVEGWGGTFKIGSEPGKGTTVRIELPRAATPVVGRMAVLLDDDMLVHMSWKMTAKAAGHGADKFTHLPWLKVTGKAPLGLKNPVFIFI
jgi:hypothetical protein